MTRLSIARKWASYVSLLLAMICVGAVLIVELSMPPDVLSVQRVVLAVWIVLAFAFGILLCNLLHAIASFFDG